MEKQSEKETYKCLVARSGYSKYDVIGEVRGSVISYGKLRRLVEDKIVALDKLPLLLYLNHHIQLLLSPKNVAKYLFTNPNYTRSQAFPPGLANCYLENHFGSKLLAVASRDILPGEELLLELSSIQRTVYQYSPTEF